MTSTSTLLAALLSTVAAAPSGAMADMPAPSWLMELPPPAEQIPLEGVLVLPAAGDTWQFDAEDVSVFVTDAAGAAVSGAVEEDGVHLAFIWRSDDALVPGAGYDVQVELFNPSMGEVERSALFQVTAAAEPAQAPTAPELGELTVIGDACGAALAVPVTSEPSDHVYWEATATGAATGTGTLSPFSWTDQIGLGLEETDVETCVEVQSVSVIDGSTAAADPVCLSGEELQELLGFDTLGCDVVISEVPVFRGCNGSEAPNLPVLLALLGLAALAWRRRPAQG